MCMACIRLSVSSRGPTIGVAAFEGLRTHDAGVEGVTRTLGCVINTDNELACIAQ